jgi:hypothetical protein
MNNEDLKSSFIAKCLEYYSTGSPAWKTDLFFSITVTKINQLPEEELKDLYMDFQWDLVLPQGV